MTKTFKKLTLYKVDSNSEQPIATFDNPSTIPIKGSIVILSDNGLADVVNA